MRPVWATVACLHAMWVATAAQHVFTAPATPGGLAAALARRRLLGPLTQDVHIHLAPGVHSLEAPLVSCCPLTSDNEAPPQSAGAAECSR